MDAFFAYCAAIDGASVGENQGEIPDNPAPTLWSIYHQMKRWDKLPEDGGLLNQPYILMYELDALDRVLEIRSRQQEQARQFAQQK
jgi:hypothetical protein